MVIFGGLGSIYQAPPAAPLLLVSLPEVFRNFAQWRLVIYGLAVIVIMVGRPQGVMGGMELTPCGIRSAWPPAAPRRRLEAELKAAEQGDAA